MFFRLEPAIVYKDGKYLKKHFTPKLLSIIIILVVLTFLIIYLYQLIGNFGQKKEEYTLFPENFSLILASDLDFWQKNFPSYNCQISNDLKLATYSRLGFVSDEKNNNFFCVFRQKNNKFLIKNLNFGALTLIKYQDYLIISPKITKNNQKDLKKIIKNGYFDLTPKIKEQNLATIYLEKKYWPEIIANNLNNYQKIEIMNKNSIILGKISLPNIKIDDKSSLFLVDQTKNEINLTAEFSQLTDIYPDIFNLENFTNLTQKSKEIYQQLITNNSTLYLQNQTNENFIAINIYAPKLNLTDFDTLIQELLINLYPQTKEIILPDTSISQEITKDPNLINININKNGLRTIRLDNMPFPLFYTYKKDKLILANNNDLINNFNFNQSDNNYYNIVKNCNPSQEETKQSLKSQSKTLTSILTITPLETFILQKNYWTISQTNNFIYFCGY